ncbi:MAG: hypothetical protein BGO25_10470 [Acidobacteriales bacterium 59-55]|nr:hypothetical protein [Terriglobales bacterium]OJV43608.1 MAG: hypothetical protein BGO25_10470 [Acidobacteriales bacterium 59-55]
MRRICQIVVLGLALTAPYICAAQPPPVSPTHPAVKHSQGFFDYALGKINPENKDYGASAADARAELVACTIQNLFFWSNLLSLTLLAATSIALALVIRTQDKREIIAATLIAQLWNGRVVDRREIVRRTEMYNVLVEAKNSALTTRPASMTHEEPATIPAKPNAKEKPSAKSGVQRRAAVPNLPSSTGETGSTGPSEPGQKGLLMENQIQALRNSERSLRARLNQVSEDLERERQRNQTLKGA